MPDVFKKRTFWSLVGLGLFVGLYLALPAFAANDPSGASTGTIADVKPRRSFNYHRVSHSSMWKTAAPTHIPNGNQNKNSSSYET